MSLAGQWDAVNGEVLRWPAIQASMDHDHQPGQKRSDVSDLSVNRTLHQVVGEQFSANRHQRIVDV